MREPKTYVVNGALEPTVVSRIVEVAIVDQPDQHTYYRNNFCEHITKIVQLLLEGRSFRDLGNDAFVDVADCC